MKTSESCRDRYMRYNMTLEAFARRILSRKHGYFHRAWLKGTHRVEVLPEEQGKPRKVRLVPIH